MSKVIKTVIITGANTGLGFATAKHLALHKPDWQLVLACRDESKASAAVSDLIRLTGNGNICYVPCNLASLVQVRAFVDAYKQGKFPPLHGIICNAGLSGNDVPEFTEDGIEMTFQVNYLSHFLLVYLLLPDMVKDARIILISSELHRNDGPMRAFRPNYTSAKQLAYPNPADSSRRDSGSQRYSTSKLCMVLYTNMLARRLPLNNFGGIAVNAINPGLMPDTGLGGLNKKLLRKWFLKYVLPLVTRGAVSTPEKSGEIIAKIMWSDEYLGISGKYFDREKPSAASEESHDAQKMKDLWDSSLELLFLSGRLLENAD